ncbi:hypothetical protein AJ80_05007 [Polytolypa hystricis UAMH7299]|uniref:Uncharacterized protein n=1 Tax=Polytolypa hystricis (strain UAMH7299) TaxID=1447883 RepID=A0A2B7Y762_POLH7|nr:hypothetical protein AJ80_05007 [Polytolypa hystricis UAMH7299]
MSASGPQRVPSARFFGKSGPVQSAWSANDLNPVLLPDFILFPPENRSLNEILVADRNDNGHVMDEDAIEKGSLPVNCATDEEKECMRKISERRSIAYVSSSSRRDQYLGQCGRRSGGKVQKRKPNLNVSVGGKIKTAIGRLKPQKIHPENEDKPPPKAPGPERLPTPELSDWEDMGDAWTCCIGLEDVSEG